METIIVIIIATVAIYYVVKIQRKRNRFVADGSSFSQNDVTVNFSDGTLTIRKHTYPVNKVTGIRRETNLGREGKLIQSSTVIIEVDDFTKPVHKIAFIGLVAPKNAEEFQQRLCVALRKAGGPSFV